MDRHLEHHLDRVLQDMLPPGWFPDQSSSLETSVDIGANLPVICYHDIHETSAKTSLFVCTSTSWQGLRVLVQLMSPGAFCVFGLAHPHSHALDQRTIYVWDLHPCPINVMEHRGHIWYGIILIGVLLVRLIYLPCPFFL